MNCFFSESYLDSRWGPTCPVINEWEASRYRESGLPLEKANFCQRVLQILRYLRIKRFFFDWNNSGRSSPFRGFKVGMDAVAFLDSELLLLFSATGGLGKGERIGVKFFPDALHPSSQS